MEKILVMADSNSGITQEEGKKLGIEVIPMPFTVDGEAFLEDINLTQEQFYEFLKNNANVSTSQPSTFMIEELWTERLEEYDYIIYFPMMASLSATCESLTLLSEKFNGKVKVIDNKRISITQKESAIEAVTMVKKGYSFDEIVKYLYDTAHLASIYICPDTLKYLKKGGRIKPAAAALATILKIKPLLYTRGDKFDCCNKCRNKAQAEATIIKNLKNDLESDEFKEYYEAGKMCVSVAYTYDRSEGEKMKQMLIEAFPKCKFRFVDPLSLSVSCHIGPNAIAAGIMINSFLD